MAFDEQRNSSDLKANLDLLEEKRKTAQVRMAAYKQKAAYYYNSRVKTKAFRVGDLVLRRATISQPQNQGKLALNWEGPYDVREVVHPGTYYLKELGGADLTRS